MKISNLNELIDFIESNDLTIEQMSNLIRLALGVLVVTSTTKKEVLHHLKIFQEKYGNKPKTERPFLLDVDISLKED